MTAMFTPGAPALAARPSFRPSQPTATSPSYANAGQQLRWALFNQGANGLFLDPKPDYLYRDSRGMVSDVGAGDPVGLGLDRHESPAISANLLGTPEPRVNQLSIKGGNLTTNETLGDPLHETWVEFVDNAITTFAYMAVGTPSRVVSFFIDVEMLDGDTPPTLGTSNTPGANMSVVMFGSTANAFDAADLEKIAPYRYRISVNLLADLDGVNENYGIVCYQSHVFRPFRVSGYSIRQLPGNHATQATAEARPTYQTDGVRHWLQGDGANWYLDCGSPLSYESLTVVLAWRAAEVGGRIIDNRGTGTGGTVPGFFIRSGTVGVDDGAGNSNVFTSMPPPLTNEVWTVRYDGDAGYIEVRRNGVVTNSASVSLGSIISPLNCRLFAAANDPTQQVFNGELFGLILREGALSTYHIEKIERELARKAGITL